MKAVLLQGYGAVDQLTYQEAPQPEPGPGEVLVRVISTSINPIDFKVRSGMMKEHMPLKLPAILGRDVAGEVTELGAGVTSFKVGDKVMGLINHSYAEFLTAPAKDLTEIPDGLDPNDAGALPLVLITGSQLIEKGVQPKSGETVLVTGALGSVGRTAVFVAKEQGATVIAGVRAKQKVQAELLGADSVVALDDESDVSKMPELDAIADTVGGETLGKLIPKLKKSGRIASVVGPSEAAKKAGIEVNQVYSQPDPDRLHQLAEDFQFGRLKIMISKRLRLSEIRQAQELAEKGSDGKIVITP